MDLDWWLDHLGPTGIAVACLVILLLIVLTFSIVKVVQVVYPIMVKFGRIAELILGRPKDELGPAKPSLTERFDGVDQKIADLGKANTQRLDAQNAELAEIKAQVTPNHGSTSKLAEDVQGIIAGLAALTQRFEDHLKPKPE
ncbi:MAG TPA: hypothetical protein VGK17_03000 [Propionicimonas sp.]|jgi:hypothetical protein